MNLSVITFVDDLWKLMFARSVCLFVRTMFALSPGSDSREDCCFNSGMQYNI